MIGFVRVAVNVPQVTGVFDYSLPEALENTGKPGCLVVVPFGKQRVYGIILERVAEPQVQEVKPVEAILDATPALTQSQINLADWMAEYFMAGRAACIDLMLPPGLMQLADTEFSLQSQNLDKDKELEGLQRRLWQLLQKRGTLRGRQIDSAIPRIEWKNAMRGLIHQGLVAARPVLPNSSVHPKMVRTAQLSMAPVDAAKKIQSFEKLKPELKDRMQRIVDVLEKEPLPLQVTWLYVEAGCKVNDLKKLAELGVLNLGETEIWRDPLENQEWDPSEPPHLTTAQDEAVEKIDLALKASLGGATTQPYLLHGVTGSGKTEIYLRAVQTTMEQGRQAVILVPEIALTPQTVRRFLSRFPGRVGLVHSKLSPGERYDTWRRVRNGDLPIIVGPRSALFMPFQRLGLIVMDECHDDSYHQEDIPPAYDAVQTALHLAQQLHAVIVLGSATPSVSMVYQANREGWERLEMPLRILAHSEAVKEKLQSLKIPSDLEAGDHTLALPLPPVTVVDMREELKAGNRSLFSRQLQKDIAMVLEKKQQAILFLNRRGTSTYIFCRTCGESLRCPNCNIPLTYHTGSSQLECHQCGYHRKMPGACPKCGSSAIRQFGTGTEKVEQEIQVLFPGAQTLRWDAETSRGKGMHEIILKHFSNHQADVLIGTQMLAKGLDLPLVTLVGVVLADVGLNLPDYRAGERTFQLLTQVAGRAGRSPLGGHVILQSFNPEHYAIQAASRHDFNGFFHEELGYRRQLGYPPFNLLVKMEFRQLNARKAQEEAQSMGEQVKHWVEEGKHTATSVIGPVPCFYEKLNGYYRWQIILRGPDPTSVLRSKPLGDWRITVDPVSLL